MLSYEEENLDRLQRGIFILFTIVHASALATLAVARPSCPSGRAGRVRRRETQAVPSFTVCAFPFAALTRLRGATRFTLSRESGRGGIVRGKLIERQTLPALRADEFRPDLLGQFAASFSFSDRFGITSESKLTRSRRHPWPELFRRQHYRRAMTPMRRSSTLCTGCSGSVGNGEGVLPVR